MNLDNDLITDTVRLVARQPDGSEMDVTREVKLVYDLLNASLDYGSGFFSIEDVTEITRLALAAGFATIPEAEQQLQAYVRMVTGSCPTCRQWVRGEIEWVGATESGRIMRLPCGHEFELVMLPGEPAGMRPRERASERSLGNNITDPSYPR